MMLTYVSVDISSSRKLTTSSVHERLSGSTRWGKASRYVFAKTGDLASAIETLESGAAILLSETLGLTGREVEELRRSGHAELADRYDLAAERRRAAARLRLQAGTRLDDDVLSRRTLDAGTEFNDIVEAIRGISGFSQFARAPSLDELKKIASRFGGAVVYLAVTRHGTFGALLTNRLVQPVWPAFDLARLSDMLVRRKPDGMFGGSLPAQLGMGEARQLDSKLIEILAALRECLAAPILEALEEAKVDKVAIALTGQLSLFPVAALFPEHYTVHVEANIQLLGSALEEAQKRAETTRLLAVGNPLPTARPLPAAEIEVETKARHFSEAMIMRRENVDRTEVVTELRRATHLHFACHGTSQPDVPLASMVSLGGEDGLSVRDLLFSEPLPERARLAVLSACQSAIPDFAKLPDEFVGLPIAFLAAGVPGVIGILWSVSDLSTSLLMARFYENYLDNGLSPAAALRAAQQWLRSVTAAELADRFRRERKTRQHQAAEIYQALSAAWRRFEAEDPAAIPFASPQYWAAFVYYGV